MVDLVVAVRHLEVLLRIHLVAPFRALFFGDVHPQDVIFRVIRESLVEELVFDVLFGDCGPAKGSWGAQVQRTALVTKLHVFLAQV